jgi:hypothetical protein
LRCAGSFGNLADDPTACTTSNFALNLPDAEGGRSCEFLYFSNDQLWNASGEYLAAFYRWGWAHLQSPSLCV